MAKRTTEAVLRAEIKVAEAALDKAGSLVAAAQDTVKAAIARLTDAQEAREEAKRRVARSEAALAAYLPLPVAEAIPDAWVAEDDRRTVEVLTGERILLPGQSIEVSVPGDQAEAASPKRKR